MTDSDAPGGAPLPSLPTRRLGATGLAPTALGFGAAMAGGNRGQFANDETAVEVVQAALDAGVTYIDTAPLYGAGISERRIGLALRGHPARARCAVATKVGYVPEGFDFTPDATRRSIHDSQARLGLEHIPLIQVHELRAETWEAVMRPGGALDALRRLQAGGTVGHVGVTSSCGETLRRLLRDRPGAFDTLFVWKHFTLLDASFGEDILPAATSQGLGVIVGTPFASGLLATGASSAGRYFYKEAPPEALERTRLLESVCERYGVPLAAASLQFCLRGPGVAVVVAGADTPEQARANVALVRTAIPDALWSDLK